ncbi:hypothetical protein [Pandoraea terrae]|uniref:hypothetical protein n=1 Tax=Pandoraea terrae TaxID=1537710 RepID=UPI00177C652D|nr:hypothetical protein [Pandoraea terrae]
MNQQQKRIRAAAVASIVPTPLFSTTAYNARRASCLWWAEEQHGYALETMGRAWIFRISCLNPAWGTSTGLPVCAGVPE